MYISKRHFKPLMTARSLSNVHFRRCLLVTDKRSRNKQYDSAGKVFQTEISHADLSGYYQICYKIYALICYDFMRAGRFFRERLKAHFRP